MEKFDPPVPVKFLIALLHPADFDLSPVLDTLQDLYGPVDYQSPPYGFDWTTYYRPEMGATLRRSWVSFSRLVDPERLVDIKWECFQIERRFSRKGYRTVNIDPGYLDLFKLILTSFKERGNKVYCGRKVWADPIAVFQRGRFEPFEWTFPDFKNSSYDTALLVIRNRLKAQLRDRQA